MARGKKLDRKNADKAQPVVQMGRIVLDVVPDTATYYVNHAEISNSAHDFAVTFAMLPPRLSKPMQDVAIATGEIHLDPIMQVIIPVTLVPGLIRALSIQKKAYEDIFGPIRDDAPMGDALK